MAVEGREILRKKGGVNTSPLDFFKLLFLEKDLMDAFFLNTEFFVLPFHYFYVLLFCSLSFLSLVNITYMIQKYGIKVKFYFFLQKF